MTFNKPCLAMSKRAFQVCQRTVPPLSWLGAPKTKYARSDDVRIAYQITGDGPFDVVWAPGTMSHLDLDWEMPQRALFFERFSKFCRLIRFDKRGTGLSDRPVKMATLEERTDDIRAVMDSGRKIHGIP